MNAVPVLIAAISLAVSASSAYADPDRNESGHGRYKHERHYSGGEFKEEFRDGNCKIERKWERNGSFKEERKCDGPGHAAVAYPPAAPAPAGVIVQPPGVVIQPPAVVIR